MLVAYALAGPTAELTASVGPAVPSPGTTAFVVGRILDVNGGGLEGARIEVRRAGRLAAAGASNDAGTFRVEPEAAAPPMRSRYEPMRTAPASGRTRDAGSVRAMLSRSKPVVAHTATSWVPGPR